MNAASTFPALLEAFFIDRLMQQRQVSPHTLASYRDTFRLLLQYAQRQLAQGALGPDAARSGHAVPRRVPRSSRTANATIAPAVATCASPPSTPSSATWRCTHPSTAPWRSACSPCRASAICGGPIAFLTPVEVAALLAAPDLDDLERASRSGPAAAGRADRAARLRTPRSALSRTSCSAPAPTCDARARDAKSVARHCARRPLTVLRSWLRERQGQPSEPAFPTHCAAGALSHDGSAISAQQASRRRPSSLRLAVRQARDAPRAAPHPGDGPASPRRRPFRDRALAGPRVRRDDIHLSACRHATQGSSARQDPGRRYARKPIPTRRSTPDLS